jgi:beta-barrel assembly-enhancing protease
VRAAVIIATLFAQFALGQKPEVAIGRQFAKEIERQYRILPDPEATGYAQRLAGRVAQSAGLNVPVSLKILEDGEARAFAFPGGFVYITTGVIARAETEAEFAGVLAHEIAHLTLRNGYYSPAGAAHSAAAARWFMGCSRWTLNSQIPLASLTELRSHEQEADTAAIQYLKAAGYDPLGMLEFYNKLRYERPRWAQTWSSRDLTLLHSYVEDSVPPDPEFIVDTTGFDAIRKRFLPEPRRVPSLANRPTLRKVNSEITAR